MKAVVPALFFATLGIPAGIVCAILLAALVFFVVKAQ